LAHFISGNVFQNNRLELMPSPWVEKASGQKAPVDFLWPLEKSDRAIDTVPNDRYSVFSRTNGTALWSLP
jgi:hypothetical protein